MASILQCPVTFAGKLSSGTSASDLLSSSNGIGGVPLKGLGRMRFSTSKRELTVSAKLLRKGRKREYPWSKDPDPNLKGGVLRQLSIFKPLKEKPKPVTLEFEKPLKALQEKLFDIQKLANETGLDFNDQIMALENNYQKALRELYTNLTPYQRLQVARHPHRPTCLDHIFNITEKFLELHGDRAGYDDPAIVTGLGKINGRTFMFMGHQKGRNTKENIMRNFGMPTPHGYRKALRMMHYADHHGFPIVTFVDTAGAYADLKCEELNQGEAIAQNLRTMFGLKVPVISIVLGEGGSGGALAIACANKLIMLENAVFFVASPEACAAILWKDAKLAPKAAKKMRITAKELCILNVCDDIIPEPLGGAHTDPEWTSEQIKLQIIKTMEELDKMNPQELIQHRSAKFRKIANYEQFPNQLPKTTYDSSDRRNPVIVEPVKKPSTPKRNLADKNRKIIVEPVKKPSTPKRNLADKNRKIIVEPVKKPSTPKRNLADKNRKIRLANPKASTKFIPGLAKKVLLRAYLLLVKDLENAIILESYETAKTTGFSDKIAKLLEEYRGVVTSALQEKLNIITSEFWQMLSTSPNFKSIKSKIDMLSALAKDKRIKKSDGFMFKVTEKVAEVLNRPDMKKKRGEVESLMKDLGVSNLDSDNLEQTLKDKINQLDLHALKDKINQLDLQLAAEINNFIPHHLFIELLKEFPIKADKEASSVFKQYREKYDEIINRPDIFKKIQEASASNESDKHLKIARVRQLIDKEIENVYYSLGLRELLKKGKADREVDELINELAEKSERILNRPDVKKKHQLLMTLRKLGAAKTKKADDPLVKKMVLKLMKDIGDEVSKVLNSLGLDELLDEKQEMENLLENEKEFTNGSFLKEKVAVGTDGSFIMENSRPA